VVPVAALRIDKDNPRKNGPRGVDETAPAPEIDGGPPDKSTDPGRERFAKTPFRRKFQETKICQCARRRVRVGGERSAGGLYSSKEVLRGRKRSTNLKGGPQTTYVR